MSSPTLIFYPDARLTQHALDVTRFDASLASLAEDILSVMKHAGAVGLSACHIGVSLRVIVLDLPQPSNDLPGMPWVLVNPVIVTVSSEVERHREGSVSMPGIYDDIERPARITVSYQDIAGAEKTIDASGFAAACIQHEIDQLDGIFWLERLSRLKRERLIKRYTKLSGK